MNATCVFVQLRLFILCQMENAAIASLPRGKLRWLKVLLKYQVSKADAVMLMHDVEDVNALLTKLAKQLPSLPSDQVVTAVRLAPCFHLKIAHVLTQLLNTLQIAIPDLPRGKWPWFVRLVKRNIMPKPEALLLLHGVNDANAIVNKLRARFPFLDVGAIAAEVR